MIRFACLLCLALLLGVLPASAQDRPLTLVEAIRRAQTQGPDASIARLDRQQAAANLDVYQAQILPRLSLNGSAPGLERSISDVQQDDGSVRYVEQSRTFSRAEVQLEQALPWTGGRVLVASGLSRVDQFGGQDFSQWQSAPVSIGLEQPLFRYNELKWSRRVEPLRDRVAERRLDADLADVAVETTRSYFAVYIAEINREIADFNVAVNDTIFGLSQGRYEIGRIAENELLESELALLNAQSARSQAALALEEARRELRQALGRADTAAVPIDPPTRIPSIDVDPDAAVAQASRTRADLLALRLDRVEARENVARAKSQTGFSANVSARFGLNQSAEALGDAYDNPLDQQRFGITFQMPLYNWGQGRARVAAAEAARERTRQSAAERRKELEREVYIEAKQLEQLEQQARIAATADTVATRRFEVARNRYTVGQIAITDLFDAQRQKDQARRAYLQTLRDFWLSYYRLRRLTLYDLVNDTPLQRPRAK